MKTLCQPIFTHRDCEYIKYSAKHEFRANHIQHIMKSSYFSAVKFFEDFIKFLEFHSGVLLQKHDPRRVLSKL